MQDRRPPADQPIPPRAGVGLKPEHFADVLTDARGIAFFEVHAENYMGAGGTPHAMLTEIRGRFPLSLHGVGLSIGGAAPLDRAHLARLRALIERYRPALFSEHLAWSSHGGVYLADLLPLPYDRGTLRRVCAHVDEVQDALGMRMLLENPSTYVAFRDSTMREVDFLAEVAARTGCGLLLDVGNVQVSAANHGGDPFAYLEAFPIELVGEIHLGGYVEDDGAPPLLVDTHGRPVAEPVWRLYERAIERAGPLPTLVEWDNDVPAYPVLAAEAARANRVLGRATPRAGRQAA